MKTCALATTVCAGPNTNISDGEICNGRTVASILDAISSAIASHGSTVTHSHAPSIYISRWEPPNRARRMI